ncbi:MAG: hypothetical protein NTW86_18640 [Candidatus Sumerlaeota bacterium]|nr:hypothetical protein [Candidatus Sumerlaeota bacterium]
MMSWNWRTGLLAQALSDYRVFLCLGAMMDEVEMCHRLHYLQMAAEKLAKGLLSSGTTPPKLDHSAFKSFVLEADKFVALSRACNFGDDTKAFKRFLKRLTPVAKRIASLAPEGVGAPNPEYPWEERLLGEHNGIQVQVHVPSLESWSDWRPDLPEIVETLGFLKGCFQAVEAELSEANVD